MSQYHGADATDAFEAFHADSEWAYRILKTLPKVEKPSIPEHPESMVAFQLEMRKKHFEPVGMRRWYNFLYVVWALAVIAFVVGGAAIATLWNCPVLGGCLAGIGWAHCGFVQHHAGHVAVTGRRSYDFLIQTFFGCLVEGGSSRWWRYRHNSHHAMPNKIGVDGDLRTTPLLAWDQVLAKKCPSWALRIQQYTFFPVLAIYVPILQYATKAWAWKRSHFDEIGVMFLHFALAWWWFVLRNTNTNSSSWEEWNACVWVMFVYYSSGYALKGIYLGYFFGLSHFAEDRVEGNTTSWAAWQTQTAVNWGIGSWVAAVASGFLNLQIEHHLFPQCPPFAYVALQRDCERYCAEKGHRYVKYTLWEASCHLFKGLGDTAVEALSLRKASKEQKQLRTKTE